MAENQKNTSPGSYADYLKARLAERVKKSKSTELPEPEKIGKVKTEPPEPEKIGNAKTELSNPEKIEEQGVQKPDDSWKTTIKNDERTTKNKHVPQKKEGSVLGILGIGALTAILAIGIIISGYLIYLQMSYSRIVDMIAIAVGNNQAGQVVVGKSYSISTFNIGFGAYGQSFSFFMDEGEMLDGTKTKGQSARASSATDVKNNINGAISLVKNHASSDFYFFQEVDTDSTRSHYINQVEILQASFPEYASVYAENAHSSYLFYPLNQPIGKMNSGILTMSKYNIDYSMRRSFPVETGAIDKFFDLDRCFSVTKLKIAGTDKQLVLINVHLSAYDDGGIREEQIKMLYKYMHIEYNTNGNYVIVGGDFNLSLAGDAGVFNNSMKTPDWCKNLPKGYEKADFARIGYSINYDISTTIGTCRDASIKYTEGVNLEVVIDGFMTSGNVEVLSTSVVDGDFKNSDHNPVRMEFRLR